MNYPVYCRRFICALLGYDERRIFLAVAFEVDESELSKFSPISSPEDEESFSVSQNTNKR